MVLELITDIIGETNASGLKVWSEEYSNPGSRILTLSILLISSDNGNTSAFFPSEDAILTKVGNFLYPYPPNVFWILSTPPLVVVDLVEYLRVSVFVGTQVSVSGTLGKDIVNSVVNPTEIPNTEYVPVYVLST